MILPITGIHRNLTKALKFAEEGLLLTHEKKDTLWEGRFQITQGAILLRMEKLDSARICPGIRY